MRLAINLATQPYEAAREYLAADDYHHRRTRRSCRRCWWATSFISGRTRAASIVKLPAWSSRSTSLDREETQARAILNKPANRVVADQSDFLNDLFARKSLSWTRIF